MRIIYKAPEMLIRAVLWLLTHSFYRIHVINRNAIPEKGAALIVASHLSYIDGLLICATTRRPVRFMMAEEIYSNKGVQWLAWLLRTIPVRSGKRIVESVAEARAALQNGEIICAFPEGEISRTGNILPFKKGITRIAEGLDVPIIPAHLDGVWGSFFSYAGGKFFFKLPMRFSYPVTISFGNPVPSSTTPAELRYMVQELATDAFPKRPEINQTLPEAFIRQARRHPWWNCVTDSSGKDLSYFKTFVSSLVIARLLNQRCPDQENIGVLLPTSVGNALTNIGIALSGRVSVNLNFTAGDAAIASAITQGKIKTVISSRQFLEKIGKPVTGHMLLLEDLLTTVSSKDRIVAILCALFVPRAVLLRMFGAYTHTAASLATLLFTSGSTGDPKGVMLTHRNVLCNIESVTQVIPCHDQDAFMAILPFFHAMGYTGCLWFPLIRGMRAVYHFNPVESKVIGEMTQKYKCKFFIGTSTFFLNYTKTCTREQFASLKYCVAGAEKLTKKVFDTFKEKYGISLLEGYGCTEMAPLVSVSTPDVPTHHGVQRANKLGAVGMPSPGVSAKIVDPETGQDLPLGQEGLLYVRGGNRMLGYINRPQETAEVFEKKWYITGDIAFIDEDGFIHIVDRLSRFSKIGGEMVPHIKIQEEIDACLNVGSCIVVSVPDERRGEALAVLYTDPSLDPSHLAQRLNQTSLPKLWIPKRDMLFFIEELPILGSGKTNFKAAKDIVLERMQ